MDWAGPPDVAELLLQRGADPVLAGPGGATALHFAAMHGLEQCALALIDAGCAADAEDGAGMTPARVAAECKHKALAATLKKVAQAKGDGKKRKRAAAAK